MSKKHKYLPKGTLVRLKHDHSIGVIIGILSGRGKYEVYSIEWLVNHGDHQNFQQLFFLEVIG